MTVGAVVDEVPQHEGLLGQLLIVEQHLRIRGQRKPDNVRGGTGDHAEACRLTIAEDATPGELRRLPHRHGLWEQHGRMCVVALGERHELDRNERRVVVAACLQLGDPLRPHGPRDDGLDVAVWVAVLRVHGEHSEVLEPVAAVLLGLEQRE